jgi:type I restriction enzyme R subunit
MDFIRKVGNHAAHGGAKITLDQAKLCIGNLFYFLDEVAYFYAGEYEEREFDRALLETPHPSPAATPSPRGEGLRAERLHPQRDFLPFFP